MKIIQPSFLIESEIFPNRIMEFLDRTARTAYKSIPKGDDDILIKNVIDRGHESVIEHVYISVRIVHNRGFTHELVRHSIASYTQESTRFCNYSNDRFGNELTSMEGNYV